MFLRAAHDRPLPLGAPGGGAGRVPSRSRSPDGTGSASSPARSCATLSWRSCARHPSSGAEASGRSSASCDRLPPSAPRTAAHRRPLAPVASMGGGRGHERRRGTRDWLCCRAIRSDASHRTLPTALASSASMAAPSGTALPCQARRVVPSAADGSVWVTSPERNAVYRIDPRTASITQRIPVGAAPSAIVVARPGRLGCKHAQRLDFPDQSGDRTRVVQTVRVGAQPTGIAFGGGAIWVANSLDSTLSEIDPISGRRPGHDPAHVGAVRSCVRRRLGMGYQPVR